MKKQRYKIRNWRNYNKSLVNRGDVTFWFDEQAIQHWYAKTRTGRRGRPQQYSDIAIQCALTIRQVFHLPLRATEGLVRSLIRWAELDINAPDYTTLCLRQKI